MSAVKNNKQLRQMFEAKKLSQPATAKVEHKLAMITATGELVCRVCRSSMKNNPAFWEKHMASPEHKMNLIKLAQASKTAAAPAAPAVAPSTPVASPSNGLWGELQAEFEDLRGMSLAEFQALTQAEVDDFIAQVPLAKKGKLRLAYKGSSTFQSAPSPAPAPSAPVSALPGDFFDSGPSVAPAPATKSATSPFSSPSCAPSVSVSSSCSSSSSSSSSSSASSSSCSSSSSSSAVPSVASRIPASVASDFGDPDDESSESEEETPTVEETKASKELPVGFFDDKKIDKSMHEQRDFTKELGQFRDIMVAAANINRQQQLADHKKLAELRQHAEEQDTKALQSRLEELKKQTAAKKELLASKKRKVEQNDEDSEDDDGTDVDLFDTEGLFGWRAKNALDK